MMQKPHACSASVDYKVLPVLLFNEKSNNEIILQKPHTRWNNPELTWKKP